MVKDRLQLHDELLELLGKPNVYFQPPSSITLKFPCIVYKLDDVGSVRADSRRYLNTKRYLVTIIDKDPDTDLYEKLLDFPYSAFEDHFVVDNLNHYICSIYY